VCGGMGASVVADLRAVATTVAPYGPDDETAWSALICPHCAARQLLVVAAHVDGNYKKSVERTQWLRCVTCLKGSVLQGGRIYPAVRPLRTPAGLPPIDEAIWEEVRACLGVGANAAAVMLCRKLLFHIAVSHGLPPKNNKDRAPTYTEAVDHLESEGLITKRMRPWVDRVKDVGNDANHELTPVTAEVARDMATFTEQLLRLAYELDALMGDPTAEA